MKMKTIVNGQNNNQSTADKFEYEQKKSAKTTLAENSADNLKLMTSDDFKEHLCSLDEDEISMVNNLVSEYKHRLKLRMCDSKLLKNVVTTKLRTILKQEKELRTQLLAAYGQQAGKTVEPYKEGQTAQGDINSKNISILEKEIFILKVCGEKLKAALKESVPTNEDPSTLLTPTTHQKIQSILNLEMARELNTQTVNIVKGVRIEIGIANEFIIAHKSLQQLKQDANSSFYLPMNNDNNELKCTNYKKLEKNPRLLLSHIKSMETLHLVHLQQLRLDLEETQKNGWNGSSTNFSVENPRRLIMLILAIGLLQIFLFLLLIMSFTYPDITC